MPKKYHLNLNVTLSVETDDVDILQHLKNMTIETAELGLLETEEMDFNIEQPIIVTHNQDGSHTIKSINKEENNQKG